MSDRLSEIKCNYQGLEEIRMWGTDPIKALAQAIQVQIKNMEPEAIESIGYLIEDKAIEIAETLKRFMDEFEEKGGMS